MDYTPAQLQRELDRTKSAIFLRRGEGFLAQALCSVTFVWAEDAVTAYTNGLICAINPHFFMRLKPEAREFVVAHLIWHIIMLHLLRGAGKNWRLWQMACDYWINNTLVSKGYTHPDIYPWLDYRYNGMAVEEIYDDLVQRAENGTLDDLEILWGYQDDNGNYDTNDLRNVTKGNQHEDQYSAPAIDPVDARKMAEIAMRVSQYAAQCGGSMGSDNPISELISNFLRPVVPWERILAPFLTALEGEDYTWRKPSPRYRKAYLPSRITGGKGGLDHIAFMGDSSGSMTQAQLVRINSEARYVKKRFNPEKLTLLNFDTTIQMELEMSRHDTFDEMRVVGRGGTDLRAVRNWIIENKPKAVVVFSDMDCPEMEPLPPESMVPILWIIFNNSDAKVPHGKVFHVTE